MTPDDPRHGTRRGYYAHRRAQQDACEPCKRGAAAAEARYAMLRAHGTKSRLDPTGTRRRIQALSAIGYTWERIDDELGDLSRMAEKWANGPLLYVFPRTYVKVAETYERLSMQLPPETTPGEKRAASRARNRARANGWPPPLAWTDIDDVNEQPRDWAYTAPDRATALRDLADMGAGITETCRRLRIGRESLQKWAGNNGLSDVYRKLAAREAIDTNQWTGRTAS